ncbi:MAG: glycosyltransferase family 10 domain-containing protein [Litorimonas sp.]
MIRIKFVSKTQPDEIDALWRPLLPTGSDTIGHCVFTFDADASDYDVLVAYEDLPPLAGSKTIDRKESLSCAPINTFLLTTEPASIRIDGPHYLRQFGHVWTAKHPSLVRHPRQIRETPPLRFFYGRNMAGGSHLDIPEGPPEKAMILSAMSSTKAMAHTVHAQRLSFMLALKERLGDDLQLFGRGLRPVDDKAEAMASYRYHVAVENHVEPGHFTEKLTDCFVAGCLPFYFGDPAYSTVFPIDSVIPIDIFDLDDAIEIMRRAIESNQFKKRQTALADARQITLDRFNTLRAVAAKVETLYDPNALRGGTIMGRHAFRKMHPVKALSDAIFREKSRKSPQAASIQALIAV